jgi:hypothetical protein
VHVHVALAPWNQLLSSKTKHLGFSWHFQGEF